MYRLVLVLSLLKVAAPSSIPIHKEIVGPDGESININIQVDIETSGGDEVDTGVAQEGSRHHQGVCHKEHEECTEDHECCGKLTCHRTHYGVSGFKHCVLRPSPEPTKPPMKVCSGKMALCFKDADCCKGLTCLVNNEGGSFGKQDVLRNL